MAMKCKRCGGPAMVETVIRLRRGFLGLHETRLEGMYCTACKVSSPVQQFAANAHVMAISDGGPHNLAVAGRHGACDAPWAMSMS